MVTKTINDLNKGKHVKLLGLEYNIPQTIVDSNHKLSIQGKNINTGTNHGNIGDRYMGIAQRHPTTEIIQRILKVLPEDKSYLIRLVCPPQDKEAIAFSQEIAYELYKHGYSNFLNTTGAMLNVGVINDIDILIQDSALWIGIPPASNLAEIQ